MDQTSAVTERDAITDRNRFDSLICSVAFVFPIIQRLHVISDHGLKDTAFHNTSEIHGVTCCIGSPPDSLDTSERVTPITSASQAVTRLTYPGGMEG